jgi:flagellar secretion chaperone FliS
MALQFAQRSAQAYRRTSVETARPTQLVLMLYGGAIRFLLSAREYLIAGNIEDRHINLIKAQKIVVALIGTVDTESESPLAANLIRVYEYMYRRLVQANMRAELAPIDEVIEHLRELRSAWEEADKIQSAMAGGESDI